MPKDWKLIAAAEGLGIPETQVERFAPVLDGLEEKLRPLLADLPDDLEPATDVSLETPPEPS